MGVKATLILEIMKGISIYAALFFQILIQISRYLGLNLTAEVSSVSFVFT
jgi:hypothetical protein